MTRMAGCVCGEGESMAGCVCGTIGTLAGGVCTPSDDSYDSMPGLVSASSSTEAYDDTPPPSDDDTPPPREQPRSTDSDPEVNRLQGLSCVLCSVPRLWSRAPPCFPFDICPFDICQLIPRMPIRLRLAIIRADGNPRGMGSQGVRRHGICCSLSRRHAHPPPTCPHACTLAPLSDCHAFLCSSWLTSSKTSKPSGRKASSCMDEHVTPSHRAASSG
jgi:hypothetical protein